MEKQQTVGSKEMASQSEDVSQQIREEYRNIQQEIQEKSDADGYIIYTSCYNGPVLSL